MTRPDGAESRARAIQSRQSVVDRYREMVDIGVREADIPARLGLTPRSTVDMLKRNGVQPSELLVELANEIRKGRV